MSLVNKFREAVSGLKEKITGKKHENGNAGRVPDALFERCITFIIMGLGIMVMAIVLMAITRRVSVALAGASLLCCIGLIAYGVMELRKFEAGNYRQIDGTVLSSTVKGYRRQLKEIVFEEKVGYKKYGFTTSSKKQYSLLAGDSIHIYLPTDVPTAMKDGVNEITSYYAYERY